MATTFAQAPLTLVPRVAFVAGVVALLGSLAPPAAAQTTVYDTDNPVYTGGTIASGRTVLLNDGATVTGDVRANGTLQFNQTGLLTISSTISGTGTLSLTNTGTLNLTGTTADVGTVVLNMVTSASAGLLQIRSGGGALRIGNAGTGTLNVEGGGVTSHFLSIGHAIGFTSGTGTLTITGGTVSTGSMGYIGHSRFSNGSAIVTGGKWAIARGLEVSNSGVGTLTIAGGTVTSAIYSSVGGTSSTASVGTATVSSGSWATGTLTIGRTGRGTLDVTGGSVTSHSANILDAVTVSGGRWDVTNRLTLAGYTGGSPLSPRLATLHIDGGSVTAGDARLGDDSSDRAIAIATVSSGTFTVGGEFRIASSHQGELNVLGGSVITGSTAYIGMFDDSLGETSVGTATVSSGGWAIGGDLVIGNSGIGTLTVNGGSVTTASNAYLGKSFRGVGTASVSSGTWAVAGDLFIGRTDLTTGTLNVNGGTVTTGSTAYLGYYSGTSNATVSSGTWAIGGDLIVGGINGSNAATLTLDGGLVSVSGTLDQRGGTIDLNAGGTLQIGTGGDGGILAVSSLVNDGTLVFDRSGASAYAGNSTGTGGIVKRGSGTLTLAGSNSHSGPTTVAAGALLVDGVVTASAVTVQGGALVGGSGTIGTLLTVQSGGTLSPGDSPGLLTVGTLDLRPGSTTLMEIIGVGGAAGVAGVDYDRVLVTTAGGLGYGGLLDLDFGNLTTFADGTTFDLFGFSGFPTGFFTSVITSGSGSYAGLTLHGTGGLWTGAAAGQTISFDESTGILRFGSAAVPEIDPAGLGSVVGLVIGALGLLERRRSKPA